MPRCESDVDAVDDVATPPSSGGTAIFSLVYDDIDEGLADPVRGEVIANS